MKLGCCDDSDHIDLQEYSYAASRGSQQAELSPTEVQITQSCTGGATYQTIADTLCIAPSTVRTQLATIYRNPNARFILEGSMRRSGDRVRVTAQLIAGQTDGRVWSERYEVAIEWAERAIFVQPKRRSGQRRLTQEPSLTYLRVCKVEGRTMTEQRH